MEKTQKPKTDIQTQPTAPTEKFHGLPGREPSEAYLAALDAVSRMGDDVKH